MTDEHEIIDWTNLQLQDHWYHLRKQLEHEILNATDETRRDYDLRLRLNSATISTDGDRSVLRVPVTAIWRNDLAQAIAYILVSSPEEDEPRIGAIASEVAEVLQRWVQREVKVGEAPIFLYPDRETRWPAPPDTGKTITATPVTPATPAAEPA